MRTLIAAAGLACFLAACSEERPPASQPSSNLEAALGACGSSQATVIEALETSDAGVAVAALRAAQTACSSAAAALRQTPLPSLSPASGPDAIDEMALGLGEIASAAEIMESEPDRARRIAQSGMATYKAGLEKLQQAHR